MWRISAGKALLLLLLGDSAGVHAPIETVSSLWLTCTTASGCSRHAASTPMMWGWRPTAAMTSTSLQPRLVATQPAC